MPDTGYPTLPDVYRARRVIAPYLSPTPLRHYPALSDKLGAEVYVKHENHNPTGAFKVRGGLNLISNLDKSTAEKGVIAASTGNHGQSIAFAARAFGVPAFIVMPHGANPGKVAAIQAMMAEIIFHGVDFDEALEHAAVLAKQNGYRFIHSANEPLLVSGVGTYALEILEALPDVDEIIVPVGGGSGACGVGLVARSINPKIQVIAVQAEKAQAAYLAWSGRDASGAKMQTAAEGLATRVPFEMTQKLMKQYLDDFVLVSEEEIARGVVTMLEATHNLVEGAGAAPVAAAEKIKGHLKGKKVVLVASGGNISVPQLKEALAANGK